jgi:hypothetical protein
MASHDEIVIGALFRHKGGKLYRIDSYDGRVRWGAKTGPDGRAVFDKNDPSYPRPVQDKTKVYATQWQVNEKYPEGRSYQAARELKIADLTKV